MLYGQDVGGRLGGVFREAATLAQKFGDQRVFNTPIQEAFIIGSTAGMSAAGLRPIVKCSLQITSGPASISFSRSSAEAISCQTASGPYTASSAFPEPMDRRPLPQFEHRICARQHPGHQGGVSVQRRRLERIAQVRLYDPNPVVVLEHKGLYWSKIPGTEAAKVIEPDAAYRVPIGKGRMVTEVPAGEESTCTIITYGRVFYWSQAAAAEFAGRWKSWICAPSAPWTLN